MRSSSAVAPRGERSCRRGRLRREREVIVAAGEGRGRSGRGSGCSGGAVSLDRGGAAGQCEGRAARPARVVLLTALFAAACTSAPVDAGKAAAGPQPRAVEVAEARAAPHPRILTLSGTLAALEKVQVAARVEGPITEVKVDLGDRVVREQELAAIRPIDYRARVSEVDASLAQAEIDVKRLESLGGVATQEELERARTRLAGAKAQRSQASRQLGDTTVRAPFAGAIAARHVAPGTYVKPGTALFDLVADDKLRLTVEVPERYAALVQVGTPATVTLKDSLVGEPGEAGRRSPRVRARSRPR
ncbi:efflux RND transporter periplasmic adaptor subunit [Nannocystis pusilla]|uniref:efflux RND transporter periplasmic adaptor subunit n=1 Tax=Nannocystis pusilla TaxID=889268 RepID=UPI003B7EFD5C